MLTHRDLIQALHCIGALIEAKDHEQFVATLVRVMHPLMRARITGYNEADPPRKRFAFVIHPREMVSDDLISIWVRHAHENPLIVHAQQNRNDSTVRKITDLVPQREFRKTALCRNLYRVMNAEYQIAMPFPMPGSAAIAIVFNRSYDFTKRDRELLTLLQPMVFAAYRNVQRMTDLQFSQEQLQTAVDSQTAVKVAMPDMGLSRRQNEVLAKLIEGKTNKQIAEHLELSIRTVEKYVEQLLRKLKVPTRAAAIVKMQNRTSPGREPLSA